MGGRGEAIQPEEIVQMERKDMAEVVIQENANLSNLTLKQKNLVLSMVADPTLPFSQHKRNAGYSENSSDTIVKKTIEGKLGQVFRDAGIYEIDIARVLAEGLSATKTIINKKVSYVNGKVSEVIDEVINPPDHAIRAAYLKILLSVSPYKAAVKFEGEINHHLPGFENVSIQVLQERQKQLIDQGVECEFEEIPEERVA